MKVLSLLEPWASLIYTGIKQVETRSWKTAYRGELYIHASLKPVSKKDEKIQSLIHDFIPSREFTYGAIIAKCQLVDCIYMDEAYVQDMCKNHKVEERCGQYAVGRYAWILDKIEPMQISIPAKGHLGIWNYEVKEKEGKHEINQ